MNFSDMKEEKAQLQKQLAESPNKSLELEELARAAMKSNQWQTALQRWNQLLESSPQHPPAQVGKGYCLIELAEFSQADVVFRELIEQHPAHLGGWEGYARVAMKSKQCQTALQRWEHILQQFPQHFPAQIGRAYCLMELGELRQAASIFQELTVQHPQQIEGFVGFAQIAMREEQWADAVERWDCLIERFPHHTLAYTSKGSALLRLENFKAAESTLQEIYSQHPDRIHVLQGLAHVSHYTNRWDLFFETLDRAIARYRDILSNWHSDVDVCKGFDDIFFILSIDGKFQEAANLIQKLEFRTGDDVSRSITARSRALCRIGFFDAVRTGADTEHFCRIELLWGAGAIKRIKSPLLIATRHDQSITGGGSLGFPWYGPGRIDGLYAAAFKTWHRQIRAENSSAYIPHPLDRRRFEVPEEILP